MTRRQAEFLICFAIAAVLAVRGAVAIWSHTYWFAPRFSPPVRYEGWRATSLGAAEIAAALCFVGVWLAVSAGRRTAGVVLLAGGFVASIAGFSAALLG
ncbi:MAG: hypothetical protein KGL46_06665 [Hyphomicrobiales bacterium]|nr:hypothetical protein [Hyphomicrobiales bacterium]